MLNKHLASNLRRTIQKHTTDVGLFNIDIDVLLKVCFFKKYKYVREFFERVSKSLKNQFD